MLEASKGKIEPSEPFSEQIVEGTKANAARSHESESTRVLFMLIHTTRKQHSREDKTKQYRPGLN
jgi:hypothetical protein